MWWLLQSSIMFAVMASNIQYHWTPPHSYASALVAFVAAAVVTAALSDLITWLKIKRIRRRARAYPASHTATFQQATSRKSQPT